MREREERERGERSRKALSSDRFDEVVVGSSCDRIVDREEKKLCAVRDSSEEHAVVAPR